MKKILKFILLMIVIILPFFIYFKFYYPFAEGMKSGELNQIMLKGYVFKTYEGRMIQSGFRSGMKSPDDAMISSYVFDFSVDNKRLADSLMNLSGKNITLHYVEYLGVLPWRGVHKKVVNRIVSIEDNPKDNSNPLVQ